MVIQLCQVDVLSYLKKHKGKWFDRHTLAKKLKSTPVAVGVSLHKLSKKYHVLDEEEVYNKFNRSKIYTYNGGELDLEC